MNRIAKLKKLIVLFQNLSLQILGEKFACVADSLNECKEWHSVLNIKQFKSISAQKNIQKGNITSSIAMNEL